MDRWIDRWVGQWLDGWVSVSKYQRVTRSLCVLALTAITEEDEKQFDKFTFTGTDN